VEQGLIHVAQGNALFPQMTVLENLKLGAYPHRARHLAATSLEQVFQLFPRLAERRSQVSRTLSGGERQMLSIGVGLMSAPSILMLDEPTLGLSPKLKGELRDAIERIQKTGVPTLVVEQDVEFLASLSQRFYLVDQGQVSAEFTAEQGLDHAEIMEMYLGVA
jgi:branched-chain amino acid transport system ATP-binding protein